MHRQAIRRRTVCLVAICWGVATTVAASAQGCGPTRLKVAETLDLDMPAARAWSLVGDFQDVGWEGSALVSGEGGNRPGEAHRAVKLADGSVIEESLYKYDGAARSLSWHIDKSDPAVLPVQTHYCMCRGP